MRQRNLFCRCVTMFAVIFLGNALPAQTEKDTSFSGSINSFATLSEKDWKAVAARDALAAGFANVAEQFFLEVIEKERAAGNEPTLALQNDLLTALIAQNKFEEAKNLLATITQPDTTTTLLQALLAYFTGQSAEARISLADVPSAKVPTPYLGWYYALSGLLANEAGNFARGENMFKKAQESFSDSAQQAWLSNLVLEEKIERQKPDAATLRELEENMKRYRGQEAGDRFARQYAIALFQTGQTEEAITLLQNQLSQLTADRKENRDILLHTLAQVSGFDSSVGKTSLQELVKTGTQVDLMRTSLLTLFRNAASVEEKEDLLTFITVTLQAKPTHPLRSLLLLTRAQLARSLEQFPIALNDASELIKETDRFYRQQGLMIALQETLRRQQPQYRLATDYIIDLLTLEPSADRKAQLQLLLADCFYLNEEYNKAATAYQSFVRNENFTQSPAVYFRKLQAEIRSNQLDNALDTLEKITKLPAVSPTLVADAQWIFLQSIPTDQSLPLLINILSSSSLPNTQKYRFTWLAAKYALQQQTYDTAETLLSPEELSFDVPENWSSDDLTDFEAHMELLRLQLALRKGEQARAKDSFNRILEKYQKSSVIELAYMEMARFLISINNLADARRLLNELVEKFPKSKYAPIALYESAISAASRNTPETNTNAIQQFTYLIETYPQDPRAFFAHLKIADILRQSGSFADARTYYEETLQKFIGHPQSYLLSLGLADTLNALNREETIDQAVLLYRDIIENESLPSDIHVEASNKLATIYKKQNLPQEAETIYWASLSRNLLQNQNNQQLGVNGRWWMSRSILHLGDFYVENNSLDKAVQVYELLRKHRLPGIELGEAKIRSLQTTNRQ